MFTFKRQAPGEHLPEDDTPAEDITLLRIGAALHTHTHVAV